MSLLSEKVSVDGHKTLHFFLRDDVDVLLRANFSPVIYFRWRIKAPIKFALISTSTLFADLITFSTFLLDCLIDLTTKEEEERKDVDIAQPNKRKILSCYHQASLMAPRAIIVKWRVFLNGKKRRLIALRPSINGEFIVRLGQWVDDENSAELFVSFPLIDKDQKAKGITSLTRFFRRQFNGKRHVVLEYMSRRHHFFRFHHHHRFPFSLLSYHPVHAKKAPFGVYF